MGEGEVARQQSLATRCLSPAKQEGVGAALGLAGFKMCCLEGTPRTLTAGRDGNSPRRGESESLHRFNL